MPTLPLTQLDERALAADLDNRTFTLTFAQPVPIQDLLLLLVRGTSLSVIPDPAIGGSFIGELKNVTVRQALTLILPPLGLDYAVDGGFIRVFHRAAGDAPLRHQLHRDAAQRRRGRSARRACRATRRSRASRAPRRPICSPTSPRACRRCSPSTPTFNVDRKAGLLQVTDFPERLDRIGVYLDAVHDRVHRRWRSTRASSRSS